MAIKSKKRASDLSTGDLKNKKSKIEDEGKLRKALQKRIREDAFSDDSTEEDVLVSLVDDDEEFDPDEYSIASYEEDETASAAKLETLSKSQKKRLKVKIKKAESKAISALKPKKDPKPLGMTSTVSWPEKPQTVKYGSDLLNEIKSRLINRNDLSFQIKPIPKHVAPDIVADLCPSALSFYHPVYSGANFGFVVFRNVTEMEQGRRELLNKKLQNKPIQITNCSRNNESVKEKTLDNFDLTKLVVMNLTRDVNRFDLGQIFKTAVDIKFRQLTDGTCAGSCDLLFKNVEEACKSFYECHQAKIRGIPIYVNFVPKGKLHTQKEIEPELIAAIKSKRLGLAGKQVDDPVASDSEEELDEGMRVDSDDEFSVKKKASDNNSAKKGKQRLHGYQQRPKNSGQRTKIKRTNYKKR